VVGALRAAGHVVDDTGDGEEALWLLLEHPNDAAVLDITMPGRDGVSVTRAVRAAGKALPVLLATARSGIRDKVSGLDAGADDYIVKPFKEDLLVQKVGRIIDLKPFTDAPAKAKSVFDPATVLVV
jgi:DNA-binding response OmpR family regulator